MEVHCYQPHRSGCIKKVATLVPTACAIPCVFRPSANPLCVLLTLVNPVCVPPTRQPLCVSTLCQPFVCAANHCQPCMCAANPPTLVCSDLVPTLRVCPPCAKPCVCVSTLCQPLECAQHCANSCSVCANPVCPSPHQSTGAHHLAAPMIFQSYQPPLVRLCPPLGCPNHLCVICVPAPCPPKSSLYYISI